MARVTINDVARAAGVSKGAASLALNGKPGVAAATRTRVTEAARRLGWRPHVAARALANASAGAFGLVVARSAEILSAEHFFMSLIGGIEAELSARGMALVLQVVPDIDAEVAVLEQWSAERRVDGVILIDARVDDPRLPALARLDLPAVAFGSVGRAPELPTLVADEPRRMRIVLEHLTAAGHRRITYLSGDPRFEHVVERTRPLTSLADELGAHIDIVASDYSEDSVRAWIDPMLREAPDARPTAVVADNDLVAVHLLRAAAARDLHVPEDLAVLALEDSPLCSLITPQVTALRRDIVACGRELVRMLAARLEDTRTDRPAPLGELLVRETSRPGPRPAFAATT
jgi:DNA-binding LacI/PurR family transcriptional regulator